DFDECLDGDTVLPAAGRAGPLSARGMKGWPHRPLDLGDFLVLEKLGTGSSGAVYRAHEVSRDRDVALKVLFRHLAEKEDFAERLSREAGVMARLDHPNIVRFYGAGQENGLPYLAMEFVDGITAVHLLRRRTGGLGVGRALHIVLCCARALGY